MLSSQNTKPTGSAIRFSTLVGWDFRWKDMTIATLTTAIYMLKRSHERNVRSLAQWSRVSEDSLGKRRVAKTGRERKGWEVDELSWSAWTTSWEAKSSLVYNNGSRIERFYEINHRRHGQIEEWCESKENVWRGIVTAPPNTEANPEENVLNLGLVLLNTSSS